MQMGASEHIYGAHFNTVRAFPRLKAPPPRSRCTVPRPGGSSSLVAGSQCASQVRHMMDDTWYTHRGETTRSELNTIDVVMVHSKQIVGL